jgi:hypothetical protein
MSGCNQSRCRLGRVIDELQICAECGREPRDEKNADDQWRTYYDGVGDGVTLCPECAREIGRELRLLDADVRSRLRPSTT